MMKAFFGGVKCTMCWMVCVAVLLNIFPAHAREVNIYSAQKEHLIRPILNKFEEQTGIKVNMITGDKAALVTRLEREGENTPADLLLTVDIGNLYQAKEKGVLQAVTSKELESMIPEHLRDSEGFWYGLTVRTRAIFYNENTLETKAPESYEALSDPRYKGQILIRSSSNVYNQSLVASMLAHHGEDFTREWLKGLVQNFARAPKGGDSDQLRALAAGEGTIAVANSYYYGRLIGENNDTADEAVKERVKMVFPNQSSRGAHVNIRGGGVTKYAKNKEEAVMLLAFLLSDEAQAFFVEKNIEYPVKAGVMLPKLMADWGAFKQDALPLEAIGNVQKKAVMLMDEAGWR